jgi:ectoine hydroxylase-related dioxygenase (phytanoyl-CoA dioxygenase family)
LQQGAPPFAPYIFSDIVANPIVEHVSTTLLGEGAFNGFYNGNTNTPGSTQQNLHMDTGHLWPNLNPSHPTASVVVNIPMIDVTEERGAIELWPGTHLAGDVSRRLDEVTEEAQRKVRPPVRGTTQKGDVLIRDMRLWHRGVPNLSDTHRHMIALVHYAGWLHRGRTIRYVKGCEGAFKNSLVDPHATFLDEPHDYLFDYRGPNT